MNIAALPITERRCCSWRSVFITEMRLFLLLFFWNQRPHHQINAFFFIGWALLAILLSLLFRLAISLLLHLLLLNIFEQFPFTSVIVINGRHSHNLAHWLSNIGTWRKWHKAKKCEKNIICDIDFNTAKNIKQVNNETINVLPMQWSDLTNQNGSERK